MKKTALYFNLFRKRKFKVLLAMKLTVILVFLAVFQVSAEGYSQEKISVNFENIKLSKALKMIEKKSDFRFVYSNLVLNDKSKVTLSANNIEVGELLRKLFKYAGLAYSVMENNLVAIKSRGEIIEDVHVRGKVTDKSTGQPLVGASVQVKGSNVGVSTDANGNYSLVVPDDAVLIITSVGYAEVEIPVNDRSVIDVTLELSTTGLNEVVVVGYGTQKKVNLTGAVTQVQGSEIEDRPVANATRSLQGIVPGLNITSSSNAHPGSSFNLNIRGAGNLSGSDQPYILIDGVEMSLSDINPDDIESISVLKDAAASAIYGARAAYGVILVTTKSGQNGRARIKYSNNFGITSPLKLPKSVNGYEFAKYFNEATFNLNGTKQYTDEQLELIKTYVENPVGKSIFPGVKDNFYNGIENQPNGVGNTDWLAFQYKKASLNQTHNLSVTGGNDQTHYYVSGGIYDENGLMRYAKMDFGRINFNLNIDSRITDWLKFDIKSKFFHSKYQAPFNGVFEDMYFHDMVRMRSNTSPYDLNGNFAEISMVPYVQSGSKYILKNDNFVLIPGIEIEPVKRWKINLSLNYIKDITDGSELKLPALIKGIDGTDRFVNRSEFQIPLLGGYTRTSGTNNYLSSNVFSTYDFTLHNDHNFTVLLGAQEEINEFQSLNGSAQDLISFTTPGINTSTGKQTVTDIRNHWATQSLFGRINYNYDEKYLLEVNGRLDGSSRFGDGHRWGTFPSFSLGYNLIKENFMARVADKIDLLKLRFSYGLMGNQSGAALYSYAQQMTIVEPQPGGAGTKWIFSDGRESNLIAPAPFNPFITWERVQSSNIGLDFGLFQNRLSGSLDIYQRDTKNMLGPSEDIADMYGGNPPLSNNANLRTRGFELTLNWRNQINENISYSLFANLSNSNSVVTKYQNPTGTDPVNNWYVGKKVGEIWGYSQSGLIQTKEEANEYNAKMDLSFLSGVQWAPGDPKFNDLNDDSKINRGNNILGDMGDMKIIGNSTPRYAYSFGGTFSYKDLSFYIFFQGIGKRDFMAPINSAYFWGDGSLAQVVVFEEHLDHWTPDNPNAYYPRPYSSAVGAYVPYQNKTHQPSDRYLQKASYLRLKNVSLTYKIPNSALDRIRGIENVKVFVSAENLFTITKLKKMFDPEMLIGGNDPGKQYILTKVVSFGLSITL